VRDGTNNTFCYIDGKRDTKNAIVSSTYNFTLNRYMIASLVDLNSLYGANHYLDEVRLSKGALYTGSAIQVPTAPFSDPTGPVYSSMSTGSSGLYGSGGGGGGNTVTHLQELNRSYLGGKGGDGYVAVISW